MRVEGKTGGPVIDPSKCCIIQCHPFSFEVVVVVLVGSHLCYLGLVKT